MEFPIWWNSFQLALTLRVRGFFFLGKYTTGDARTCIQGFLTLYTEDAYAQAKATLVSRYGDNVKVAQAYKKRINDWPAIKGCDAEGLQKYAEFLW